MKTYRTVIFTTLIFFSFQAYSKDACYQGYDSSKCLAQAKIAREKLKALHAIEEKFLLENLKDYQPEIILETISQVRATRLAYENFNDLACYSDPFKDGMSGRDSGVIADACRVEWRVNEINILSKKLNKE